MSSPRRNVLGALALLLLCSVLGWRVIQRHGNGRDLERLVAARSTTTTATTAAPAAEASVPTVASQPISKWVPTRSLAAGEKAKFTDAKSTNRLRNTAASADRLVREGHALLLRNAFVDTANGELLAIPAALRSSEPGAYIVQSKGPIGPAFRARLASAGARIIGYMPVDAFLVQATSAAAQSLADAPETAAVLAYEPYFKLEPGLLPLALAATASVDPLKLVLTVPEPDATMPQIAALGGREVFRERGVDGTLVTVEVPGSALVPLAQVAGVHLIERWLAPVFANDKAGYALGSSTVAENTDSYLGLTGAGVLVNINDSGVDAGHPDLTNRVFTVDSVPAILRDVDGHGTHVAGIIAGNGAASATVAGTPQGSVTNARFKGKAPAAELFVLPVDLIQGPASGDIYLQETAARSSRRKNPDGEPLISNNSWGYGSTEYGSHSASYDAAVRDALPEKSGDQPVLYVFSAGNSGFGGDNGQGGDFDSINTPGNAKNVITVGALESSRDLTNSIVTVYTNTDPESLLITVAIGSTLVRPDLWPPSETNQDLTYETNFPFAALTDSAFQVAGYSSRGNVGIGTEGDSGRFKPDLVTPGTFVLSARSSQWRLDTDFPPELYPDDYTLFQDLTAEGAPHYRYETGTSMSAPAVAGLLAQMQEYFQGQPGRRPSAAGYKALLLNSAQPTSPTYFPDTKEAGNYGGWGQPNLPRALSGRVKTDGRPVGLVESDDAGQSIGLATGEARSYRLDLAEDAANAPLRLTLVWTDPPGNPAAAAKLVNDLDLVVSNTITGEVIYGNDFSPGVGTSEVRATNDISRFDRLNNVERIVFDPAGGTNFVISVVGYRVNVNARTDHTNAIVQDFALAIASAAPVGTNAAAPVGTLTATVPALSPPGAGRGIVTGVTNGGVLFAERVGANSPLVNGRIGQTNQWHFYTFTNSPGTNLDIFTVSGTGVTNYLINGSNVAFVTFPVGNLSRSRTNGPDIDLYVSTNAALLDLAPDVVKSASRSAGRDANELVFFTNSPVNGIVYYVGVKSEDQQAAEYGFIGISSKDPFNSVDANGVNHPLSIPILQPIPDGTPNLPGVGLYLSISIIPGEVRTVTPQVTFTHQNFGDLLGNLSHTRSFAVLDNHGQILRNDYGTNVVVTYDDLGQRALPGRARSDGPGSLVDFMGFPGVGAWFFSTSDNARGNVGRINGFDLGLLPNDFGATFVERCVDGGLVEYEVINVPADASKMTITVTNMDPALPLEVFIRREELPDLTDPANNDKHATILPPGGDLVLGVRDSPPLQAGRYFIAVYNPHGVRVCYRIRGRLERELDSTFSRTFTSDGPSDLTDRAVAYSKITINETRPVSAIQVGIRVEHPRGSDLAIRLVNPAGSSSLLAESRGTTNGQGFGRELVTSNGAFSHFAFVYDRASTRGVLYVNGVNVAEGVFPGYAPVTSTPLYFGFDPSPGATTGARPGFDDFALWGGPLRSVEVLNIFRNGLGGLGKNADSASSTLISLWPFDADGFDDVGTNNIKFSDPRVLPGGRIGRYLKVISDGTPDSAPASPSLDVAKGRGFTLDGWVSAGTKPDVTIAGWGGTNGLAPALLANATGELGNGPGSVSVVLSRNPLRVLKSPAGAITTTGKTTNTLYAVFTELTNQTSQLIKFAEPPFFTDTRTRLIAKSGFNTITTNSDKFYRPGDVIDGWLVVSNLVLGLADASVAYEGVGCISLFPQPKPTRIRRTMATLPGRYYTASFAYRKSPNASSAVAQVELLTGGVPLTTIDATSLWQTNAYTFLAVSNTLPLDVRETTNSKNGVLLDAFRFIEEPTGYYLAEEPIKAAALVNALGDWRLEVTDGRGSQVGKVLGWQITLTFAPTNPVAVMLTNTVSYATHVVGNDIKYFIVDVPPEAARTTNFLQSLTGGPLNLLFAQNGIPDGNQPEDQVLLTGVGAIGGTAVLTTNLPPVLVPGQRYYLGVQNAAPGASNTFAIRVDLGIDVVALSDGIPYIVASTNDAHGFLPRGLIDYYSYDVSTNAIGVRFAVTDIKGDLDLIVGRGPRFPDRLKTDYASSNPGTEPEEVFITPESTPVPLSAGRWYLGVYSLGAPTSPYRYSIVAEETLPIMLTNHVPRVDRIATNGGALFYAFDIRGTNATSATFTVTNLTGNADLYLRKGLPLPLPGSFDYASENLGTNAEQIVITPTNSPVALSPGRWFLSVVPAPDQAVSYTIVADLVVPPDAVTDLVDGVGFADSKDATEAVRRYRFTAPAGTSGILFELYGMTADLDLFVAKDVFPSSTNVLLSSARRGLLSDVIVVRTNAATTDLGGTYYLEVRGPAVGNVAFTVRAATRKDGLLVSGQPIVALVSGEPLSLSFDTIPGETYKLESTTDLFAVPVIWKLVPLYIVATGFSTTVPLPPLPDGVPFLAYRLTQVAGADPVVPPVDPPVDVPATVIVPADPSIPLTLSFASTIGAKYQVESTADVFASPVVWTPALPVITASGPITVVELPATAGGGLKVYRVRQVSGTVTPPTDIPATVIVPADPSKPLTLSFASTIGAKYQVESTADVFASPVVWTPALPVITALGAITVVELPATAGGGLKVYRVRQVTGAVTPPPASVSAVITLPSTAGGPVTVSFDSTIGAMYQVEFAVDPFASTVAWTPVLPVITALGAITVVELPATTGGGLKIYRVRQVSGTVAPPTDLPSVIQPSATPGGPVTITFASTLGAMYQVESTDDLFASPITWVAALPVITATGSVTVVEVPSAPAGVLRIFRVRQVTGTVTPPPTSVSAVITLPTAPGGPVTVSFDSTIGAIYQVESTDDLSAVWRSVGDPIKALKTTTALGFTDPAPTGTGLRLYRVRYISGP